MRLGLFLTRKLISAGIFISCLMLFSGCGKSDNAELSATELINNPNTADANADPDKPLPQITFEEPEFNFGEVPEGNKVQHLFKFKNTGKAPLIISGASASCGCTVPSYPKKPIEPGETEEVTVVFDTKNKAGNQMKVVTITANTNPSQTEIALKGLVTLNAENTNK